jgi:hypothetical protein
MHADGIHLVLARGGEGERAIADEGDALAVA